MPILIQYRTDATITPEQFIDVLRRSGLAERRPVDDPDCIRGMLDNTDLLATAWEGDRLVGVSRSVTDFHYVCYLSDLAVDEAFQKQGIGKRLIDATQRDLGPKCKIVLLAAPASADYYRHIGFEHNPRCWMLFRNQHLDMGEEEGE